MPAHTPFDIIDCHIHPATGPRNHFDWFMPCPRTPEEFIRPLMQAGIRRACGAPVQMKPLGDFAATASCNRDALAFHRLLPDFYIPAIQVHPRFPDESCREIETSHPLGVRWIGELVGYCMGYGEEYDTPGAFRIYDLAQQLGMAVNFHGSDMAVVERMCRAFPRLPFVLAHPTANRDTIRARAQLAARLPNLYVDLSGTGITRWGMIRACCDIAGPEKFLFGTDYPICTPESFVACVMSEPLTDHERALIFAGNFLRITGIK